MPALPALEMCPDAPQMASRLLQQFLVYSSKSRIAAADALVDEYFYSEPYPAHHLELPIPNNVDLEYQHVINDKMDWSRVFKNN